MRSTKIVCTIGPASRSPETLERLTRAGMDVARLNFSHGSQPEHGEVIASLRAVADRCGRPIAILQDLSGLKIRLGEIKNGSIVLEPEGRITLTTEPVAGNQERVSVTYSGLPGDVQPGDPLLLSDGALELEVLEVSGPDILCRVVVGGPLSSHKGINLPTRSVRSSGMTEKDRLDLAFGIEQGVDLVALSFVRSAQEVRAAREFMSQRGASIPLIAKIEKHEALTEIDAIVAEVDGIMVARGDLGVEIPPQKVPGIQKMLIEKCNLAGKPVITATHMLRSMVDNPRPTRAEVTDVANAIWDGTDAVMLSEESAVGKYPVQSVQMMVQIALEAEGDARRPGWALRAQGRELNLDEAVARASCRLAEDLQAAAIVTCTRSGGTARNVSRHRPRRPIIAVTPNLVTLRQLCLSWGVHPILTHEADDTDETIASALEACRESRLLSRGDRVVVTAGVPAGSAGTNLIKAEEIP